MKYAIVTFLVIASTAATVAVAQDGTGQGPPIKPPVIIDPLTTFIVNPLLATPSPTTASVPTTSEPKVR